MESWQTKLTLRELADRWSRDEGALLNMAAGGVLQLSTQLNNVILSPHLAGVIVSFNDTRYTGPVGILSEDAEFFRQIYEFERHETSPTNQPTGVHKVVHPDGDVRGLCRYVITQRASYGNSLMGFPPQPELRELRADGEAILYRSALFVFREEVERLEKLYPELRPKAATMTATATPPYLDTTHPEYASKLAAAIAAWEAVALKPLPRNKTPKQAIIDWLERNASKYGLQKEDGSPNKLGIEEVAKVANWKPQGPPKIGE